jgi:3-dehydroquinate dehydratase/shikimate dehydrogenase
MMNTAFRRETVNAVYLALQTAKADDLFKLMREVPIQGLSVTMPLKQSVVPHLERTDPLSAKIGAVNTILRGQDGKFYGFNTDVAGILGPLERRLSLKDARVLVLGAGGVGRAAVFGCRDKGAEVFICNRTSETAQKLARQAGAKTVRRDALAKLSFDVIINATPLGMTGLAVKNAPVSPLEPAEINARYVFDLVYNPIETPLLRMARQKGIAVISGVEMFVQQGARQFEIWTGKPAPEEEMLRVVLHALRQGADTVAELPQSPVAPAPAAAAPATQPPAPEPAKKPAPKAVAAKPAPAAVKKPAAKPVAKSAPAKKTSLARKPRIASSKLKPSRKSTSKPVRAKVTSGKAKARSR